MIISNTGAVVTAISAVNECVTFFQWVKSLWSHWNRTENQEEDDVPKLQSSLGSHSSGTEKQELKEDDVLKLQISFQCLRTLPAMYNFTNQAERRRYEKCVAQVFPELKAAVWDTEDLLEDFRCYEQKVKIEGSVTSAEPGTEFFHDFIQGSFSKLVHIQLRLPSQYRLLEEMSLHQASPWFNTDQSDRRPLFFQTLHGKCVLHDLIHDMAVSICVKEIQIDVSPMWEPQHFASTSAGIQATTFHTDVPHMWHPPMSRRQRGQIDSDSSILKVLKLALRMNKDMSNALHRERQKRKKDSKRIKRGLRQIKKLRKEAGKEVSPSGSETEELEVESEGEQYPDFDALISQVLSEQQYGQSYASGGGYGYGFGGQFHTGASSSSALQQHQHYVQSYAPGGGCGYGYGFGGQFHPGASSSSALQQHQHQQFGQSAPSQFQRPPPQTSDDFASTNTITASIFGGAPPL